MLITNIIEYNFILLYGFIKTDFLYIFPFSKHYLKTEISNGKNTTSLRNDIVAMRKERKTKCCLMSLNEHICDCPVCGCPHTLLLFPMSSAEYYNQSRQDRNATQEHTDFIVPLIQDNHDMVYAQTKEVIKKHLIIGQRRRSNRQYY